MILSNAKKIAARYKALLKPHCERIEIAGSIRRECVVVSDIELVLIPKKIIVPDGLFDFEQARHPLFVECVNSLKKIKGDPSGKYTQRLLPEGIKLDIFIATPNNWGLIYAIRTGPAQFSHKVLGRGWRRKGLKSESGMLTDGLLRIPVHEERELFDLIGVRYIAPQHRGQ